MIGQKLSNRYEIAGELGRGGMGVVFRAHDPMLNRDVAVKLIPPGSVTPAYEERFQREAHVVAQMDHPSIVPIYDLGRHEGSLFFVMPVVPGVNLRRLVREGGLSLGDVLEIAAQVAEALDYSHERGVVHRDIKPENVIVAREKDHLRVRVMDFGLAFAAAEDRLTKTGTLVGTVAYFSPEQIHSRSFDGRSDIYALGTLLYECLVGEPPFSGEPQSVLYRIIHQLPQSPRAMGADVREELEEIVLRCLEKDPARRPQRAGQVAEALRRHRSKLQENEYARSVVISDSRVVPRPALAAPFVGREKEFARLQQRLDAAGGGECQLALVAGEPGIGKTRLLAEVATLARACKVRVLQGRFVEHSAFSHQGFCELIQNYFRDRDAGSSPGDRPDLSDLAGDLLALFPVLSEISELRSADDLATPSPSTRPRGEPRHGEAPKAEDKVAIFELLARTLARLAQGKPLLLVLEDLHGADASIEALEYVVRRLAPTPTLVAASYRQTEVDKRHPLIKLREAFEDDPRFLSLTLGPFSPSEHRALVESVAGGSKLSDALARRLFDSTEGNPFFTKELVRSLIDSGGMAKDASGAWGFSGERVLAADGLPATIQQAIEKRVRRLPDEMREVLQVAAVFGRSFELRDLEAIAHSTSDLDDAVERLVRDGLLEEEGGARGDRLSFASGIVRDVLYAALPRRKRRSLHRKYAELLESRYAGRLERVYPELVHHFSQGDVPEKTVEYGLTLAEKLLQAADPDEAIRVAGTALEFLDDEWSGDRTLAGQARMLLARGRQQLGSLEEALSEAGTAVACYDREGAPERALEAVRFGAEAAWQGRRADEAQVWVERGVQAARRLGAADHLTKLLALAATLANLRGEYQKAQACVVEIERLTPIQKDAVRDDIRSGGRLVVALANPVTAREPSSAVTMEEYEVLANVYETLVARDEQGELAPCLAESWAEDEGKNGRSIRLRLRPGVRFSDGSPLTAAGVKSHLERAIGQRHAELPAVFAAIAGVREHLEGAAPEVAGLRAPDDATLVIELKQPLPIFPALLTDLTAASGRAGEHGLVGTGPFTIASWSGERIVLEKNPHYWRAGFPRLEAIEFRTAMNAAAIAAGLREGTLDVGRDLLPEDLDEILRTPRFRRGLVETPKLGTYFVLFNASGPATRRVEVRRALAGSVRAQDFVWSTLGRFALPATGLLPPGILGHDPGRRRPHLTPGKAAELLRSAGVATPLRLRASMHPIYEDRYRALTAALLAAWKEVGVEVEVVTSTMAEFLETWHKSEGIDALLFRWSGDYDDPDNFGFGLFHSENGLVRSYVAAPEIDRLLEEARTESRPAAREALYRRFEDSLMDAGLLLPLFHEVDYRVASPEVEGLKLRSSPPFVNYAEARKAPAHPREEAAMPLGGGVLEVPFAGVVLGLDPAVTQTIEEAEVYSAIFDNLTRCVEDRVVPWLASEIRAEANQTRFWFRLRTGVRFHDGRPLTARDVRYSIERLFQSRNAPYRNVLASIRGAERLMAGETAELQGFQLVSPHEFVLELSQPVSFFPALLSSGHLAILPEGTGEMGTSWRRGCVGTGPFRVVGFEPGRRVELERNPSYWRDGYPRSETLVFRFGVPPEEIKSEFMAGRLSLASDLLPSDVEELRHDPRYASGYRECPSLSTYFVAFNIHSEKLADARLRRALVEALDVPALLRRSVGRLAVPASGFIPPGLLGHRPTTAGRRAQAGAESSGFTISQEPVELTAVVNPVFLGEYAAMLEEITRAFREMGFVVRRANKGASDFMDVVRARETDLYIGRWVADYPDADTFVYNLNPRTGYPGRHCGTPEIERLAEQARAESDPRARHALYRQVEEILARDALLLPLFHEQIYRFARPEVDGLALGFATPAVAYEELRIRR